MGSGVEKLIKYLYSGINTDILCDSRGIRRRCSGERSWDPREFRQTGCLANFAPVDNPVDKFYFPKESRPITAFADKVDEVLLP